MFEKEELQLIYKAISELTIKGIDSHVVSGLLNKVATLHEAPPKPTRVGAPEKAKVEK